MADLGAMKIDGDTYTLDEAGQWSGPDADVVAGLAAFGTGGLSVMPPGYTEFYLALDKLRAKKFDVEVLREPPPLPPLPEGAVS